MSSLRVLRYPSGGARQHRQSWCSRHPNVKAVAAVVRVVNGNLWNRPACAACATNAEHVADVESVSC